MSSVLYLLHGIIMTMGVGLLVTASLLIDDIKDPDWIKCTSEDCREQHTFWLISTAFAIICSVFALVGYADITDGISDNEDFDFEIFSLKLCPWNRIAIGRTAILFAAIAGAVGFGLAISHLNFLSHLKSLQSFKGDFREDYFAHALTFLIFSGMIPTVVVSAVFIFYTCFIVRRGYERI